MQKVQCGGWIEGPGGTDPPAAALSLFPPGGTQNMTPLLGDLEARQADLHPSSASKLWIVALPGATVVALAPNALALGTALAWSGCSTGAPGMSSTCECAWVFLAPSETFIHASVSFVLSNFWPPIWWLRTWLLERDVKLLAPQFGYPLLPPGKSSLSPTHSSEGPPPARLVFGPSCWGIWNSKTYGVCLGSCCFYLCF